MHTYSLRTDDTKPHEMTAPDLLHEVAARVRWKYHQHKKGHERARSRAAMLDELVAITPGDADGWALITYFRLAGALVPIDGPLETFATRLATLAELYWFATAATAEIDDLEVPLDVAGALRISDAWVSHASSRKIDPRYRAMSIVLMRERVALEACLLEQN